MRKSKGSTNFKFIVRKSKGSTNPFCIPNTLRNTIANLFLNTSQTLTSPFFSHFASTLLPLWISLPPCDLFIVSPRASVLVPPSVHTPSIPSHLTHPSLSHSTPSFEHRPKAHFSIFIWHGPDGPLLPLRRVALRGRGPPLLGCLVICHHRGLADSPFWGWSAH